MAPSRLKLYQAIFIFYLALFSEVNCVGDLPQEIEKCRESDTACIAQKINEILQRYPDGNPAFGLPKIENMQIKNVVVAKAEKDRPISLNLKFNTLNVKGFRSATVERAVGFQRDPYTSKFEVYGRTPLLSMDGEYEMDGKILFLPIKGKGMAHINMTDVKFGFKVKTEVERRDDKNFMLIKMVKPSMQLQGMKVHFEHLFGTNEDLDRSINNVINENWREIWNELQHGIINAVSEVILNLLTDVMKVLPYDNFYKEE